MNCQSPASCGYWVFANGEIVTESVSQSLAMPSISARVNVIEVDADAVAPSNKKRRNLCMGSDGSLTSHKMEPSPEARDCLATVMPQVSPRKRSQSNRPDRFPTLT